MRRSGIGGGRRAAAVAVTVAVWASVFAGGLGLWDAGRAALAEMRRAPAMREMRDGAHLRVRLDELAGLVADARGRPVPFRYAAGDAPLGEWSPRPFAVAAREGGRVLTVGTVGERVCAELEMPAGAAAVSVNGGAMAPVPDVSACVPDRLHRSRDAAVHEKRNVIAYLLAD